MNRKHCIILTLLLAASPLAAQEADTAGWHMRLSTGTSVSSGFGRTQSLSWVAPSFEFHPTSRLTVNGGFAWMGSLIPGDYKLQGLHAQSLAPLRSGTQATGLWAEAEYQVNDRLWLWGAVAHIGGMVQPLWLDHSLPLQTTAFSGGIGYRIGDRSLLEMHIHIIKDNAYPLGPSLGGLGTLGGLRPLGGLGPLYL